MTRSDNEGIEVAADTNNVSSFSPVSSVINNTPKNFATSAATYIGENAFSKSVEKAYLVTSRPMYNNIRVRDAKFKLSEAGIKGTAIDTVKEWLEKIDKQLEEVERERREKARKYWPF
ncbi:hypothetical protein [Veillonella sp.]